MSALAPSDERQGVAKPVSQLVTVGDLNKKLDSLRRGRAPLDMQWKLNLAFYKGRQYSFVNRELGRVQSLPTEDGDKPRYRIRLVSNQIITGSHSLLAKYTKTKPVISATPGSGSADDAKAAQLAERLLEYWWTEFCLDDKLAEALLWSIICGQGYWLIEWDQYASTPMTFTLGPDGKPITNEKIKAAFLDQLRQRGIDPQQKTVYLGDIRVSVPSPFNVYLDPSAQTFDDCKYAIIKYPMDPDMVKSRWGVDVTADSIPTPPDVALTFATGQNGDEKTTKDVYCGYFLPTPSNPKGRVVWWTKGVDKPLEDKPWPEQWSRTLPLIKFPGLKLPGSVYDTSQVEQAIPMQKELNRTLSQMVEYKNLTIRPRVWAPTNSLRTRLTSEPGALYEYNPVGQFKPEVEQPRALPPYVFDLLKEVKERLAEVFALTDISEGNVPPNVEAGIAIDLLQELSADRLMPTIKLIERQLARAGQIMLELAQSYYIEPRHLAIYGSGGSVQVRKFSQADIKGGVTVHVETGSGLPRTRAGRQAQIERWVEMQLIPADRAWKYLEIADLKGLAAEMAADEDQAQREIDKIISGEPINPEEIQNAMQAVNRGINPDTGDPIQSPQEAQQILKQAGLKPRVGENYDTHLAVVGQFMKGVEFEGLPIETRQDFITHWNLTLQAKMALPQMPAPEAVKTTLQLKGTVGPTVAAEILNRTGVPQVTPEQMAEPPLETWVTDSVDKPDTDAAGPGQEANQLSQAAATVLESNAKIADAAHQAQERKASTGLDHVRKDALHQQQMQHAEEKHAQGMRHAEIAAQQASIQARLASALAEKKLKESSFKPQPKATPAKK